MKRTTFVAGLGLLTAWGLLQAAAVVSAEDKASAGADKGAGKEAPPAVFVHDDNDTQHVLFRNADGNIMEVYRRQGKGEQWETKNLTAEAGAPKAASNPSGYVLDHNNSSHVIYRGEDGQVHELFLHPERGRQTKWQHANLTATTRAPKAAGRPCGYAVQGDKTQHVVFRAEDGSLYELYHAGEGAAQGWHAKNLTAEAGAPKAAGNPSAYVLRDNKVLRRQNAQHVVYRGEDGHVHELYVFKGQDRWAHSDLTTRTKAPAAAGDPHGYAFDDRTQHVVFRAEGGDVIELFHKPDGQDQGWHSRNLTQQAAAPKAAGDPCGFDFNDKTQHVVYRGEDGQVHELFYTDAAGKWGHKNLSAEARAPKALSDPAAYAFNDKTQHVIFRSEDGKLVELSRSPDSDDKSWQANALTVTGKGR